MEIKMPIVIDDKALEEAIDKRTAELKQDGDFVLVTRCKDCEYSKLLRDNENEKHIFRHCRIMNAFVTDNSFCSYAEPKEIEGE